MVHTHSDRWGENDRGVSFTFGEDVVRKFLDKHELDMIALPHPSGASTWHRTEPGKSLLVRGLALIAQHAAWQSLLDPRIDYAPSVAAP